MITPVSAYINVTYILRFRRFLNVKTNSSFRFL